jgi:hypothetical protein
MISVFEQVADKIRERIFKVAHRNKIIFLLSMAKKLKYKPPKAACHKLYFRWLTLLLASCSPAELASSSGSNAKIGNETVF